jgi:hypothetical protein
VAQGREAAEGLKPAISAVAVKVQVTEVVESLKRATSVVAEAARMPWVALGMEETNVRRAIAARRAGALPRAALAVRGVRRAAAAVHHGAVAVVPVGAAAVVADVDEQEWEIRNKRNSDED